MKTILQINHLTKYFGKKLIIDDLSMEVYAGEVFGFLGPNGAGKTTTIKVVMGFLRPDSGEIYIDGESLKKNYEKAMAKVGGIVENPEVYKDLSGQLNLELYARLHEGVTKARIDEVINLVGMGDRIKEKVKKYSLGMKQRLGLAQALLHKPKLLILDEPTNGLDPAGIKELRNILIDISHNENVAVMVSSHQLAEMDLMCDRVAILKKGRLINVLPIKDLLAAANIKTTYSFFTADPHKAVEYLENSMKEKVREIKDDSFVVDVEDAMASQINLALSKKDILITAMIKKSASLEDAYINITGGGNTIA